MSQAGWAIPAARLAGPGPGCGWYGSAISMRTRADARVSAMPGLRPGPMKRGQPYWPNTGGWPWNHSHSIERSPVQTVNDTAAGAQPAGACLAATREG
jgi:hypothetical protein